MGYLMMDDGTKLYHRIKGKGQAIVCIHGFGADSRAFRLTERVLPKDYSLVTMDLRGHGKTKTGGCGVGLKEMSKDIHHLIEHLGLEDITMLGWSMGGVVTMEYLRSFGHDKIKNLILVETSPKIINDKNWKDGLFKGDYSQEAAQEDLLRIKVDFDGFARSFMERMAPDMDRENLRIAIEMMKSNNPDLMAKVWEELMAADYRDQLESIDIPTYVISGKNSTLYSLESGKHLAGSLKRGLHITIDGGHLAPIASPVEFNRALKDFIDNLSANL